MLRTVIHTAVNVYKEVVSALVLFLSWLAIDLVNFGT